MNTLPEKGRNQYFLEIFGFIEKKTGIFKEFFNYYLNLKYELNLTTYFIKAF